MAISSFEYFEMDETDIRNVFSEFIPEFTINLHDAGSWVPSDEKVRDDSVYRPQSWIGIVNFDFNPKLKVSLDYGLDVSEYFKSDEFKRKIEDVKTRLEGIYNASIRSITHSGTQIEIIIYTDNDEKV